MIRAILSTLQMWKLRPRMKGKSPVAFHSCLFVGLINAWTLDCGFLLWSCDSFISEAARASNLSRQRGRKVTPFSFCLPCSDAVSVLEKEHDYRDQHFDFIQSHSRRFCLQCILGLSWGPGAQASLCVLIRVCSRWGIFKEMKCFLNPEQSHARVKLYMSLLLKFYSVLVFET